MTSISIGPWRPCQTQRRHRCLRQCGLELLAGSEHEIRQKRAIRRQRRRQIHERLARPAATGSAPGPESTHPAGQLDRVRAVDVAKTVVAHVDLLRSGYCTEIQLYPQDIWWSGLRLTMRHWVGVTPSRRIRATVLDESLKQRRRVAFLPFASVVERVQRREGAVVPTIGERICKVRRNSKLTQVEAGLFTGYPLRPSCTT